METTSYLDPECSSPERRSEGIDYWKVSLSLGGWLELMGSMNGEVRIWDVRAPEKPLYESVAQSHGLAGLAVHAGAPVLATYVSIPSSVSSTLISRTSAPSHDLRQRLVIQGFSDPTKPKTLSRLSIPLSPNVGGPQRPVGFMPSAASLAFHPVSILVPLSCPGA
jgi:regulator-associated protein of mTOR